MKKLFKNSFFSFFKNKLAIVLLMIIVFLTTATFTMFNSATHAFQKSYDQVMTEGNRHEYTVKEMYDIHGDIDFTVPVETGQSRSESKTTVDEQSPNYYLNNFASGNPKYVVFETDITSSFGPIPTGFPTHVVAAVELQEAIDFMNAQSKESVMTHLQYMVDAANNFAPITSMAEFAKANGSSAMSTDHLDGFQPKNLSFEKIMSDADTVTFLADGSPVSIDRHAFEAAINKVQTSQTTTFKEYAFVVGDSNATEADVKSALTNGTLVPSQKPNDYFDIANSNLSAFTYKFEYKVDPANPTAVPTTNSLITPKNGSKTQLTLGEWQDQLKISVDSNARKFEHIGMLKEIQSHPELIYKDVQSFKVTNTDSTFKFVSNNPQAEVDKLKIFDGSNLLSSGEIFNVSEDKVEDAMFDKMLSDYSTFYENRINELAQLKTKVDAQIAALPQENSIQKYNDIIPIVGMMKINLQTVFTPEQQQFLNKIKTDIEKQKADLQAKQKVIEALDPTAFFVSMSTTISQAKKDEYEQLGKDIQALPPVYVLDGSIPYSSSTFASDSMRDGLDEVMKYIESLKPTLSTADQAIVDSLNDKINQKLNKSIFSASQLALIDDALNWDRNRANPTIASSVVAIATNGDIDGKVALDLVKVLGDYKDNIPEVLAIQQQRQNIQSQYDDSLVLSLKGEWDQFSGLNNAKQTVPIKKIDKSQTFYTGWSTIYTNSLSTYRVIDPSAFAAVVSPTYASTNGVRPISSSQFKEIINSNEFKALFLEGSKSFVDIKDGLQKIASKYGASKSLIWAGQTPYFVTGTGITPDFAFPIVSTDQPIPNTQNQAIIYTNNAGFLRMKDANPGAQTEDYIAIGFKEGFTPEQQQTAIQSVVAYANKSMSWPTGIQAVEKYDSSSETVILAPQRISFLEKLNHTISSVSWIVTSLLVLFTAFIVSLVIKKQIDNRKKQLGILLANGYSKMEIAASMMVIGLIVALIPAFAGYLTGHWLQFGLMNIFHNYWTLPIWQTQFSWITLVVTVVAPLAGIALLAFLISLWALKGRIPEILAGETSKNGLIVRQLMKPAKWFGIKTKMGLSLVFSNVGKLTIAFIAFAASIIALTVSINSVGKFNYAADKSEAATNYEYQVDLITPTSESGLYSARTLDEIYFGKDGVMKKSQENKEHVKQLTLQDVQDSIYPKVDGDDDHSDTSIYFHVASMADSKFAVPTKGLGSFFPFYLKNRIQTKTLLNFEIVKGTNPWVIASQMMPENQRNTADLKEDQFIDYAVDHWLHDAGNVANLKRFPMMGEDAATHATGPMIIDNGKKDSFGVQYRLNPNSQFYKNANMTLDQVILEIYGYGLWKASNERLLGHEAPLPYMMSYNNVLVDNTDETYTHIDIDFNRANIHGETKVQSIKIRGLDKNLLDKDLSKIKLSKQAISALEKFEPSQNNGQIPIVINKYFKEFYNLSVGDTFTNKITNTADRYMNQNQKDSVFKVVAVDDTYNDGKLYTLQDCANDALGLSSLSNPLLTTKPFNGVMTSKENKDPLLFDSLSLYSLSGIYPGKNRISKSNTEEDGYESINWSFFEQSTIANAQPIKPFANPAIKSMSQLIDTYGTAGADSISPMSSMYSTVDWTQVSDYQFQSIMSLSSSLMNTVQAIVMFIALAFVLLISTMIIADNTRFIATLKVMGYRTKEISRIFLSTFVPSLILALIIAIPISFGLLEAIRVGIMGFGHVLIPLYLVGWEIAAAFAILVIGFLVMYYVSQRGLKNTSLLKAFQE